MSLHSHPRDHNVSFVTAYGISLFYIDGSGEGTDFEKASR